MITFFYRREQTSDVDHEAQGLRGVTAFIPLMVKVLANSWLRWGIISYEWHLLIICQFLRFTGQINFLSVLQLAVKSIETF